MLVVFVDGMSVIILYDETSYSLWSVGSIYVVGPVLYSKIFLKGVSKIKKIEFYKKREVYTFDIDKNFKNLSLKNFKKKNLLFIVYYIYCMVLKPFYIKDLRHSSCGNSHSVSILPVGFPTP